VLIIGIKEDLALMAQEKSPKMLYLILTQIHINKLTQKISSSNTRIKAMPTNSTRSRRQKNLKRKNSGKFEPVKILKI